MIKRVLIVDDSTTARSIIRRTLEISGMEDLEIGEASNGLEALETLKANKYDLVFTDINMPDMNGEQLLKRIKSSPKLNDIPVVVISSMTNESKENKLLKEHAEKIFSKPLSLPDIQDFLESYKEEE